MKFAGIDYDSNRIDVVLVDVDDPSGSKATATRYPLTGPMLAGDAFERARRIRQVLPTRGWWHDAGVLLIGIEQPTSHTFNAAAALSRAQGAILACLPAPDSNVAVMPLRPQEWKQALGLPGTGKSEKTKGEVRAYAIDHGCPDTWPQDAFDAYCIARAALELCDNAAVQLGLARTDTEGGGPVDRHLRLV